MVAAVIRDSLLIVNIDLLSTAQRKVASKTFSYYFYAGFIQKTILNSNNFLLKQFLNFLNSCFRSVKFQSSHKRKLIVEEEIIEEDKPQEKNIKIDDDQPTVSESPKEQTDPAKSISSSSSSSSWEMKNKSALKKTNTLMGIVKPNVKKESKSLIGIVKPLIKDTTVKITEDNNINATVSDKVPSGLSLLGAYSDSDNSD